MIFLALCTEYDLLPLIGRSADFHPPSTLFDRKQSNSHDAAVAIPNPRLAERPDCQPALMGCRAPGGRIAPAGGLHFIGGQPRAGVSAGAGLAAAIEGPGAHHPGPADSRVFL